ncbi:MAG: D-alanyl-D-alanine carboxypeptidase/D-alanyl-D-alanine-endopeptidase [Nitrospirae bacterium]|nr:D-alanyl-D-alanine carboxypeptidase/D-alanyl-D-alanine-endopeptidase [Nitrospirota bacterium]
MKTINPAGAYCFFSGLRYNQAVWFIIPEDIPGGVVMAGRIVRRHVAVVLLWVFISVTVAAAEKPVPSLAALRQKIDTYLKSSALSQSRAGIKIVSLKTGETLYSRDNKLLFHPASTLKLFTTATALKKLGGAFRLRTVVYADSQDINEGTLRGNLYLKGFADPQLSTNTLSWIAGQLRSRGIERVDGGLVCDETYLDNWYYGKGWMWDDASSVHYAPIGGLSVNNNCVVVRVSPGSGVGEAPSVVLEPQISYVTIKNTAITVESQSNGTLKVERRWRERENVIAVTGEINIRQPEKTFTIDVTQPALYTCLLFYDILAANKIAVSGKVEINAVANGVAEFLSYTSAPLYEIIKVINKKSNNLYAELLLKTLGAELQAPPGTAGKGVTEIKAFLRQLGIDGTSLEIVDGSGVSRYNLISPGQLVDLLVGIYRDEDLREAFIDSLAIAGVDGTLKGRMRHTPAEGGVRAKTGSMTGVSAIAGYAATQDTEPVVFSIMIENFVVDQGVITDIQDRILVLISSFSRNR